MTTENLINVKNYPDLVKDTTSNAILNNNDIEFNEFMLKREKKRIQETKIKQLEHKINNIEEKLDNLINLLSSSTKGSLNETYAS